MLFLVSITGGLVLLYAVLFILFRQWWNQVPLFLGEVHSKDIPCTRISVIIPARNEETNIGACLQSILQQNYPAALLEIIVVDDHSTDKTAAIVQSFRSPLIHLISLTDDSDGSWRSPKKYAIETGIKKALGQLIVTTDADCVCEPGWLTDIEQYYRISGKKFIAAPVKINSGHSLLSRFQSLDFLTMQGITAAVVYKQFMNMCNGANLAYEKAVFFEVGGFSGIDTIASGDDMLLMHKVARRYPGCTGYLKSKEAIVTTAPALTWKDFIQQRIRWASKATNYKEPTIFLVLLLVYLTNFSIFVLLVLSFLQYHYFLYFLAILFIKFMAELIFVRGIAEFFNQQRLLIYLLVLQPVHIMYIIVSGFFGQFRTYQWKGRKLK